MKLRSLKVMAFSFDVDSETWFDQTGWEIRMIRRPSWRAGFCVDQAPLATWFACEGHQVKPNMTTIQNA